MIAHEPGLTKGLSWPALSSRLTTIVRPADSVKNQAGLKAEPRLYVRH